jgi:hypothetical protein
MKAVEKITFIGCWCMLLIAAIKPVYGRQAKAAPIIIYGDTIKRQAGADQKLLNVFESLCKKLSNVKGNYTIAGTISITDYANPTGNMKDVGFLFCKQVEDFYYKLGTTVTLNEQGAYIFIDYQHKAIMLSEKKQVAYDAALKSFGDIGANIKSENYKLISKINGNEQTLSLINEHHISCKQYSITFNRHTLKIKKLHMRLSNLNDPLRTDNEKIVDVNINQWENTADITKYLTKNSVIRNVGGKWEIVNAFKNYRLIKM